MSKDDDIYDRFASKAFIVVLVIATFVFVSERIIKHKLQVQQMTDEMSVAEKKLMILDDTGSEKKKKKKPDPVFAGKSYLIIVTEPEGAEVWFGGSNQGTTPLNIPGLESGELPIRIKHPYTEDLAMVVSLKKDQITRLEQKLTLKTGTVKVTSKPDGAAITIDGKATEKTTPAEIELTAGQHQLELSLNNYAEYDQDNTVLHIEPDKTISHHSELEPTVTLIVNTSPPNSVITIQNRDILYEPLMKLPTGDYQLLVSAPGHQDKLLDIQLAENSSIPVSLEKSLYSLNISTEPENATIHINGIEQFSNGMALPPDDYEIEISADGYLPQTRSIKLEGNLSEKVSLRPNFFPEMTLLNSNRFTMGGEHNYNSPQHEKHIEDFYMARKEVTFRQWNSCSAAGICRQLDMQGHSANSPVVNISWDDVQHYLAWINKETGKLFRLPSEAEWEYAASAMAFSGNSPDEICLYELFQVKTEKNRLGPFSNGSHTPGKRDCQYNVTQAAEVGALLPNKLGIYDLWGNVREWTDDCWHANYLNAPKTGKSWLGDNDGNCSQRVIRGGSWKTETSNAFHQFRHYSGTDQMSNDLGFRLALSVRH